MTTYAGWQLRIFVATGSSLDSVTGSNASEINVQRISYDYVHNLDVKEATGQRTAYAIIESTIGLTGTVEMFWTGSGTGQWTRGAGETGSLTEKYIGVFPNGTASGQPYDILNKCKFGSHRIVQRPGSALRTETMDFIGINITTGSVA